MVKVSKIEIEIGDMHISITPEQARELYQALGELVVEPNPYPVYRWYNWDGLNWTIPAQTGQQPLKPPYTITCTSDTAKISV